MVTRLNPLRSLATVKLLMRSPGALRCPDANQPESPDLYLEVIYVYQHVAGRFAFAKHPISFWKYQYCA